MLLVVVALLPVVIKLLVFVQSLWKPLVTNGACTKVWLTVSLMDMVDQPSSI